MAADATLSIEVIAKIANYTKQMEEAANKTKESAGKMGKEFDKLSQTVQTFTEITGYLAAIYGVGSFFGKAIREANDYNLEINRLSMSMDISLDKAAALKEALGDLGIDTGLVAMAQGKLAIAMRENSKNFTTFGISTKDASGNLRSTFDVLMDVISLGAKYQNQTDRTVILNSLFGRGSEQLKGIFRLTNEELAKASDEVERYGRDVTPYAIAETKAWNRTIGDLKDVYGDAGKGIGNFAMKAISLFDPMTRKMLEANLKAELAAIGTQAGNGAESMERLTLAQLALLAGADGEYDKWFKTLEKIDETFGKEKAPDFTPWYAFFNELEKLATPQVLGAFDIEKSIEQLDIGLESVKERFTELRRIEEESFSQIFNAMTSQFATSLTGMITGTVTATEGIRQIFASMITGLINMFIQMGLEWVKVELSKMLFAQKTQAVITGTKIAGTAAEIGLETTSVGVVVAGEAGKGAARTAAWWAGVNPFVALGLGVAMGAAIAALAGGFRSAAGGWANVPVDGAMAQLHKGEMVLPAQLAEGVRNMVDGGQSGGGVNNYYIQAMDASSFDTYVKANAGSIFAANKLALRNGSQFA